MDRSPSSSLHHGTHRCSHCHQQVTPTSNGSGKLLFVAGMGAIVTGLCAAPFVGFALFFAAPLVGLVGLGVGPLVAIGFRPAVCPACERTFVAEESPTTSSALQPARG